MVFQVVVSIPASKRQNVAMAMILAAAKDMLPRSMDCDQEDLREEENQELFVQRCDYRSLMGLKMSDFSLH